MTVVPDVGGAVVVEVVDDELDVVVGSAVVVVLPPGRVGRGPPWPFPVEGGVPGCCCGGSVVAVSSGVRRPRRGGCPT